MKVTRFAKRTVLLNCLVPIALLGWDAFRGRLGANPVNFAIRTTGILALIFLMLTLLVTPVSRLLKVSGLGQFRRMFGLCAFFHTLLHFLIFFGKDRGGSVVSTFTEIIKRPYLMVGFLALSLMIPLAVTSTDAMIRRLGGKRWKALHRLTYLIAIAGVLHFYMLVKADIRRPVAFGIVLGLLLGYRIVAHYLRPRSEPATSMSKPKFWSGQLKVARIFQETPAVRTFRLVSPDSSKFPFEYLPGQYLNVSFTIDKQKITRSYTIASSPTREGYCELTVKREEHGISSKHLHDKIREGDLITISAPAGRFTFTGAESDNILMIAGGVGITPLMSKIRYLTDIAWPGEISLLYAVKSERDIIFREELDSLRKRFPNFHLLVTLSRQQSATGEHACGRITPALLKRFIAQPSTQRVHICGPESMMEAVLPMLSELGLSESQVKRESFVRPALAAISDAEAVAEQSQGNGTASITFSKSKKTKEMTKSQTVLEASEELGIDIPYDCRSGICGQCKTRLISGRVVMDVRDALDLMDRSNNIILSCQARCVDEVVVEA